MTMVSDWLGTAGQDERETQRVERDQPARVRSSDEETKEAQGTPSDVQKKTPSVLRPLDPALKQLLERGDERLLRDIGLSRESPFAEVAKFWANWSRQRGPWGL